MAPSALRVCLALSGASLAAACGINPEVYTQLFEDNMPMFEEITKQVIASKPKLVLDLGTGPGEPSVMIAKALPEAQVIATDLQEPMLQKARQRAEAKGVSNLKFRTASADNLQDMPEGIDAVTMCYVLMFVPDRQKAIQEVMRVLRPGGRAYISVWKSLSMMELNIKALEQMMGKKPEAPAVNPMALSADRAVEDIVAGVKGIVPKSSTTLSYPFKMRDGAFVCDAAMIMAGPAVQKLIDAGQVDAKEQFCKILVDLYAEAGYKKADGSYEILGNAAQLLVLEKASRATEL